MSDSSLPTLAERALRAVDLSSWSWSRAADRVVWEGPHAPEGGFEGSVEAFAALFAESDLVKTLGAASSEAPLAMRLQPARDRNATLWLAAEPDAAAGFLGVTVGPGFGAGDARLRPATEQLLLDSIRSIVIGIDASGRIRIANRRAGELFGIEADDALGRPLRELLPELDWRLFDEAVGTCLAERAAVRTDDLRLGSGESQRWLGFQVSPWIDAGGDFDGILLVGADITERLARERLQQQSQKLEAIGQLAAGIAHEINTPTQFISDNTRFVEDALTELGPLLERCGALVDGEPSESAVQSVIDAAAEASLEFLGREVPRALQDSLAGLARVSEIVDAMRVFCHPGQAGHQEVDLNRLVEDTLVIARNEWRTVAVVERKLAPELPRVLGHRGELSQVLLNLVVNAAHAIEDADRGMGSIRVETSVDREHVVVEVADDGVGIAPEAQRRVFDPFYTTKEVGRGTGQGLAVAHALVAEHGGTLTLQSVPGTGSVFRLCLPIAHVPLRGRGASG